MRFREGISVGTEAPPLPVALFNGMRTVGTSQSPMGRRLLRPPHSCSRACYELISKS